ncbi:MAG: hypothetical protein AAF283_09445, partial [Cyanobacteria bacterium P01_A01_bin.70]
DQFWAENAYDEGEPDRVVLCVSLKAEQGEDLFYHKTFVMDLKYEEDVAAAVDCNVVLNDSLDIIEVQGTAEAGSYSRSQLNQLLDLAETGIQELLIRQQQVFTANR